jgi:hypothetical protein
MANLHREIRPDGTLLFVCPVATATPIEIGDLLWYNQGDMTAHPAADFSYCTGDLEATQEGFAAVFLGCALSQHRAGDAVVTTVNVAPEGEHVYDCAAAQFDVGDLVAPDDNGAGDALLNQQVISVGDFFTGNYLAAIARVSKDHADNVEKVEIRPMSTVMTGGIRPYGGGT